MLRLYIQLTSTKTVTCFLTTEISFPLGDGGNSSLSDLCLTSTLSQPDRPSQSCSQAVHSKPGSVGNPPGKSPFLPPELSWTTACHFYSPEAKQSSILSQFVNPKSFNLSFSLEKAAFYMKIRASKDKQKFASSVYKLCTHAGNKHCPRLLQVAVKESQFRHLPACSVRTPSSPR